MSTAVSQLASQLQPFVEQARVLFERHPRLVTSSALAAVTIPWFVDNFRKWDALGGFGAPKPIGYTFAMVTLPLGRETLSTEMYDADPDKSTWIRDPHTIPERRGSRPKTGWHFFPHRQLDRYPNPTVRQRLVEIFDKHAAANTNLVEVTISPRERSNDAIVIKSSLPAPHPVAKKALREIAHWHHLDHSMHMIMAPQDCKLVIERGWGERHPASGSFMLVKEQILIYAPRDEEELEVIERLLLASIGYMTGSRNIN